LIKKRAFKRFPSHINVRFNCGDTDYSGTITNISKCGMFIKTGRMSFPFESQFIVVMSLDGGLLHVRVKVIRITKSDDIYDGIGVALLNAPKEYISLVDSIGSTH
jgi:hypothetical protein